METIRLVAKHSSARDSARLVAMGLAFYAQRETHLSWPSDRELREWTGLSKSQVQRALRYLERVREIQRQRRQHGDPRRTYLIDPAGAGQLALFGASQGVTGETLASLSEGLMGAPEGLIHAGAGSNQQNHRKGKTPPTPPQAGGHASALISELSRIDQRTRASEPDKRAPRARKRRRDQLATIASEPCPLQEAHEAAVAELEDAWRVLELEERLRPRLRPDAWAIWFHGAHLHALGEQLALALPAGQATYVRGRFGPLLRVIASEPIVVVGCQALDSEQLAVAR